MTGSRHALSLSSSTYKNYVLQGFAQLQQNDEFVDMTLAADGHLVKVHRTLVALASPYFKDLLRSLPCPHPVIYLNGVSNEALGYILEYIYTGETEIPSRELQLFMQTAQELQIVGLNNIRLPKQQGDPVVRGDNETINQDQDTEHVQPAAEDSVLMDGQVSLQPVVPYNSIVHNEDNYDLQPQEQSIDPTQSQIENENTDYNDHSPSNFHEPVSSEETNGFLDVGNINTTGQSISITLNENAITESIGRNPVAKIEILSNILINGDSDMAMTGQDQLPQSYTEALGNLNEDISIDQTTNISMDIPATSQELFNNGDDQTTNISMDRPAISQELSNNGDDIPMSEDEDISESGCDNSAAQNALIEIINVNNTEQLRELGQQDSLLYTSSNRGAVQLILNDYMYYCHYQRDNGRRRRWRCIDYRDCHCPASVDTVGEEIVDRKQKHCHPNHEEKIKKKIKRINFKCFPTIQLAEELTKQGSDLGGSLLYTSSNRGGLQLILNRFMYYCHYHRDNGRRRRWRCIDYRDCHCPASIDTIGEEIIAIKHEHCHPNHEEKLSKKMCRSNFKCFTTIRLAEALTKKKGSD